MPIDRSDIRRALLQKGFREESGDHHFYTLWVANKKTPVFTKLSHGTKYKTYGDDLLAKVCRQLSLTKKQFLEYVECTLSESDLIEILSRNNRI